MPMELTYVFLHGQLSFTVRSSADSDNEISQLKKPKGVVGKMVMERTQNYHLVGKGDKMVMLLEC